MKTLKTNKVLCGAALLAASLMVSCTKEPSLSQRTVDVYFHADETVGIATKTAIDAENHVSWTNHERFKVIETADNALSAVYGKGTLSDGKISVKATLKGNTTASAFKYGLLYPESAYRNETKSLDAVKVWLRTFQSVSGSVTFDDYKSSYQNGKYYASSADLLVSKIEERPAQLGETDNVSASFKRVAAVGKLTVLNLPENAVIESVKFAAEGKKVSGDATVNFETGGLTPDATAVDFVNISVKDGSKLDNNTVVFTCLPFSVKAGEKFSVTVLADGKFYESTVTVPEGRDLNFLEGRSTKFSVKVSTPVEKKITIDGNFDDWSYYKDRAQENVQDNTGNSLMPVVKLAYEGGKILGYFRVNKSNYSYNFHPCNSCGRFFLWVDSDDVATGQGGGWLFTNDKRFDYLVSWRLTEKPDNWTGWKTVSRNNEWYSTCGTGNTHKWTDHPRKTEMIGHIETKVSGDVMEAEFYVLKDKVGLAERDNTVLGLELGWDESMNSYCSPLGRKGYSLDLK